MTAAGVGFPLVAVPAGEWAVGSANGFYDEAPRRAVALPTFRLGATPVTQAQWAAVVGTRPARFAGDDRPVESVPWAAAVGFCDRLAALSGERVRLPTEWEWEAAARAGTAGDFFFHPAADLADDEAVSADARRLLGGYAWFADTAGGATRPVGRLRPNPWGLFDVVGNVWEWCGNPFAGNPAVRAVRGGAWDMSAFRCRSCYRSWEHATAAHDRLGLRVLVEG